LNDLIKRDSQLVTFDAELRQLEDKIRQTDKSSRDRGKLHTEIIALRRQIAFSNPLLDFQQILVLKSDWSKCPHMVEQYFGFYGRPGGGLCVVNNPFGAKPEIRDLLAGATVENGPMQGKSLEGGTFLSPALSYDGRTILFAWTKAAPPVAPAAGWPKGTMIGWGDCCSVENGWGTPDACYHIFKVNTDGTHLQQLTDGPWNDFHPCFLPDGRIVFVSERRGGYGRCFNGRPAPTATLHRMNSDGTDMVTLSWHETNEWNPSVTHDGSIVYTRWDYVDRGACIAHHPWLTSIDGRDARSIHGNYPVGGDRTVRPDTEMEIRAIPNSPRFVATAAPHHGHTTGSLVIFDPRIKDDDRMGAVKRLTPETSFPESEGKKTLFRGNFSSQGKSYSSPYPLAEDYYLCSANGGIWLIDGFGNQVPLCGGNLPFRNPIPIRQTTPPPIVRELVKPIPARTTLTAASATPKQLVLAEKALSATVSVIDVYNSRLPWPKDIRIKALRIIQVLPKSTWPAGSPSTAPVGGGNNARRVLGTVPVETDGSAHFLVPPGKAVYFQALDERGLAVQSMRSDAYCQPGERLTCAGCHEERTQTPPMPKSIPLALRREPSNLTPEAEGSNPYSGQRLVEPAIQRSCISCHREKVVKVDLGLGSLAKKFGVGYDGEPAKQTDPIVGGSRSFPGQVGARASKLLNIMDDENHKDKIPFEDFHRITLWLDCICIMRGDYGNGIELD
jgi:hypothetical protein